MFMQMIDYLKDKTVLIMGFGREGRSTYDFLRRYLPEKELTVSDMKQIELDDKHTRLICGENYMDAINDFDVVIKSPGISVRDVTINPAVEVTCQSDLFLRYSGCRCVGITGTKGKTTTSTLTYLVLKAAGIPTCLIGNIGVPVFEMLEKCEGLTPVIEMSSHQLEFCRKSPYISVLTNIYEEHLDHYNGMAGYVGAKLNIFRNQDESCHFIYAPQKELADWFSFDEVKSTVHSIGDASLADDVFLKKVADDTKALVGAHNKRDVLFAAAVARILGVSNEDIANGVSEFKGIPHRMEYVGSFNGISFYNDSIATIPHAVMCGVAALDNIQTLIIGGMDRGLDYSDFVEDLYACPVRNLICLPETGHKIGDALLQKGSAQCIIKVEDMVQAVKEAFAHTKSGYACLLSPAASSYNVYKNFEEKGEHYKKLIWEFSVTER